jgi:hypothetical protein
MTRLRPCAFGISVILIGTVFAQERAQINPEDVAVWVNGADSIVIGTFRAGWPLPWFDGWHYQSQIDVREELVPQETIKAVNLSWTRPFGTSCLICDDLRPLDGHTGIWFLRKRSGALRVFGGTTGWCSAPLDLRYLNAVRDAIRNRSDSRSR